MLQDRPAKALYFEYVTDDTNGDGKLTSADKSSVSLARPDGSGVTEVLHGVDRVLSYDLNADNSVSVLYQTASTLHNAKFAAILMVPLQTTDKIIFT